MKMNCNPFSLTPALSRWERENCFQSLGKSAAGFCSTTQMISELFSGCSLAPRERVRVRGNEAKHSDSA